MRTTPSTRSRSTPRSTAPFLPGSRASRSFRSRPTFTHTLEPARPVQGRVIDKQTGKPLAGHARRDDSHAAARRHAVHDPNRRRRPLSRLGPSGGQQLLHDGLPAADSGYLRPERLRQDWPAGAKALEVNFALERGQAGQRPGRRPGHEAANHWRGGRLSARAGEPEQQGRVRPAEHGPDRPRGPVHDHDFAWRRGPRRGDAG